MSYSWDHAGRAAEMVRIDDARRRDDEWRDDVRAQNDRARAAYDLMLPEARRQSDAQERIAAALEAMAGTSYAETTRAEHTVALGLATARIGELEGERDELLRLLESAPVDDPWADDWQWAHDRQAIVARIEKATKGTT